MTSITLENIKAQVLDARKSRDIIKSNVLNTLIAEVCRDTKEPTEENVVKGVRKFLKNLKQAISHAPNDSKLVREAEIISKYIPILEEDHVDFHSVLNQLFIDNPEKYLNDKTIGWFVGQTMRLTSGKANPDEMKEYLRSKINEAL